MIPKSVSESGLRLLTRSAQVTALLALGAFLATPAQSARWNWSGSVVGRFKKIDDKGIWEVLPDDVVDNPNWSSLAKIGTTVEASLKATVDVSDEVTVNTKVCTSCHGITVDQAYAEIRFNPLANLEAGRINVPFGDFYQRHDPANDAFLSKPLPYAMGHMLGYQATYFNLGVIPMPYVDHGVSLFGDYWVRDALQIWYALYGVNGFRSASSSKPADFNFEEQTNLRGSTEDNNKELSWGARLALAQGPVAWGASYLRGDHDQDGEFQYEAWGIDASAYVRGIQLRSEYLERETDVFENDGPAKFRKKGFYAQVEAPVKTQVALVGRFDGMLREGAPLNTANDETSGIIRWTFGVNVTPTFDYAIRVHFEHWRFTDFDNTNVLHVGTVITY